MGLAKDSRVSIEHWPANLCKETGRGIELVDKRIPPSPRAAPHSQEALESSSPEWDALRSKCVCSLEEERCGEEAMQTCGFVDLYNMRESKFYKQRADEFVKILRPADSQTVRSQIVRSGPLRVALHHFNPTDLVTASDGRISLQRTAKPFFKVDKKDVQQRPAPPLPSHLQARKLLGEDLCRANPQVLAVVVDLINKCNQMPPCEQGVVTAEDPEKQRRRLFLEHLEDVPARCKSFTGEESMLLVRLLFDYINARGALDELTWWRSQSAEKQEKGKGDGGRQRELSSFESFVLFLCKLHAGSTTVDLCTNFGVSEVTVQRTFITMLKAVHAILSAHFKYPSLENARRATPTQTRIDLQLDEKVAVFIGDATERAVENPHNTDFHCLVYSQYKSRTTLKHNVVITGNGYMCEISRGYPGSTSDNALHEHDDIAARMAATGACGAYNIVYLYDKGLTQFLPLEQSGIRVITPWFKESEQTYFDEQSAHNQGVAKTRTLIEINMGNCRTYAAFDELTRLSSIDLSDLIADTVRCLVNFWAPQHAWDLTADTDNARQ